jgi:membrane protein
MEVGELSLREKSFYFILLFIPFANIITLRLSSVIVYIVITLLLTFSFILNLYKPKSITVEEKRLFFAFIPIFLLSIGYLISTLFFYIENFDSVLFFLQTPILVSLIPLFIDIRKIIEVKLSRYLTYIIILISVSIFIDFLLLNVFNLIHLQPMYRGEDAYSYLDRPFGLFGQPSVNTAILVGVLLLKRYIDKKNSLFLNIVSILAIIAQGSGTGFMSLLIYIIALLWEKHKVLLFFGSIIISIILYYIIVSEFIPKIGLEYLTFTYYYFEHLIIYFFKYTSTEDLWLGFTNYSDITIDFGPIYMISKIGLLYFIAYSIYLLLIVSKVNSSTFRFFIISLALSNLHYPVMFYVIMHFIWIVIYYITFCKPKKRSLIL